MVSRTLPGLSLAALLLLPLLLSADTVVLHDGRSLQGEILKQTEERVVVDLGFTVLDIPRRLVAEIRPDEGAAELLEEQTGELYHEAHLPPAPIKDLVQQFGEAVVKVSTPTGFGSGFLLNREGYVVTNHHVIERELDIRITIFREEAKVLRRINRDNVRIVALNPQLDLALLKLDDVEPLELSHVLLGNHDEVKVGDQVFAIGSPLGLERTVSEGIVSMRNRAVGGALFIQTTTPINPGNSGGPLFNERGEVIGVINMKIALGEALGFAIPASFLKIFLKNRDAFAFDENNPNTGYRYFQPPGKGEFDPNRESRAARPRQETAAAEEPADPALPTPPELPSEALVEDPLWRGEERFEEEPRFPPQAAGSRPGEEAPLPEELRQIASRLPEDTGALLFARKLTELRHAVSEHMDEPQTELFWRNVMLESWMDELRDRYELPEDLIDQLLETSLALAITEWADTEQERLSPVGRSLFVMKVPEAPSLIRELFARFVRRENQDASPQREDYLDHTIYTWERPDIAPEEGATRQVAKELNPQLSLCWSEEWLIGGSDPEVVRAFLARKPQRETRPSLLSSATFRATLRHLSLDAHLLLYVDVEPFVTAQTDRLRESAEENPHAQLLKALMRISGLPSLRCVGLSLGLESGHLRQHFFRGFGEEPRGVFELYRESPRVSSLAQQVPANASCLACGILNTEQLSRLLEELMDFLDSVTGGRSPLQQAEEQLGVNLRRDILQNSGERLVLYARAPDKNRPTCETDPLVWIQSLKDPARYAAVLEKIASHPESQTEPRDYLGHTVYLSRRSAPARRRGTVPGLTYWRACAVIGDHIIQSPNSEEMVFEVIRRTGTSPRSITSTAHFRELLHRLPERYANLQYQRQGGPEVWKSLGPSGSLVPASLLDFFDLSTGIEPLRGKLPWIGCQRSDKDGTLELVVVQLGD